MKFNSKALLIIFSLLITACESTETANSDGELNEAGKMIYSCPMNCEGDHIYEIGGTCPECGMDLVGEEIFSELDFERQKENEH